MSKTTDNTKAKIADLRVRTQGKVKDKARSQNGRESVNCSACRSMVELIKERVIALEKESHEASREAQRCWDSCEYSGYEMARARQRVAEEALEKCRNSLAELEVCIGDPMARDSHFRIKNTNWR